MATEMIKNHQGRYDIEGISDAFEKNGQTFSGIAGYSGIDGWLLSHLGYAFAFKNQDQETIYLNANSAAEWLNRHPNLSDGKGHVPPVIKRIQLSLEPVLKLKVQQNEQGRYDIDAIPDSYEKGGERVSGIVGYGRFIGWILYKLGLAFALVDENNILFYLNKKSSIHWLNRHGQVLDIDCESSIIIQTIQEVFEKQIPLSPKKTNIASDILKEEEKDAASQVLTEDVQDPSKGSQKVVSSPNTELKLQGEPEVQAQAGEKKLRRANAKRFLSQGHPQPQMVSRKRSSSDPVMRQVGHLSDDSDAKGFSSPRLEGLNLNTTTLAFRGWFKSLNVQFQAKHTLTIFTSLGLSEEDVEKINAFVATNEKKWSKSSFKRRRYYCEKTKLPRTLDIFKEGEKLYIMVLCKKKGGMDILGKGCDKKAYMSIDWKSQKKYADLVLPGSMDIKQKLKELERENALSTEAANGGNIATGFMGLHSYISKNGKEKIGLYMPLYENRLDKIVDVDLAVKAHLMADLLNGLYSLQKAHIDHRDLKGDNVYISEVDGKLEAFLADFGCARQESGPRADQLDKYEGQLGNDSYRAPEKIIARRMRRNILAKHNKLKLAINKAYENKLDLPASQISKDKELEKVEKDIGKALTEINQFIDETWMHNDTWAIGFLCLGLLALGKNKTQNQFNIDSYAMEFERKIIDTVFSKLEIKRADMKACFLEIQQTLDKMLMEVEIDLVEPLEKKMFAIVRELLQVDPSKRIVPQEAVTKMSVLIS